MDVQHGEVPRAHKLDRTVASGSPHNDSRKLSRERALAENAIGILHHAFEREIRFREGAKCGVQMAHEHGRRNTLARNIPQHKEQAVTHFKRSQ